MKFQLNMKPGLLILLKTFLTALFTSVFVFLLIVYSRAKFGIGDIASFTFFTVIFSLVLSVLALVLNLIMLSWNAFLQYIIYFVIGFLAGFLWTVLVAVYLG